MFLECQHALTVTPAGQTNYIVRGLPLTASAYPFPQFKSGNS